ncbi:type II toxin-antitoxin system RelE/ParE family toxin [Algoriphagus formosus]
MSIKSKGKGKSGGARVVSLVKINKNTIFLLSVYDKAEKENISNTELKALIELIEGEEQE